MFKKIASLVLALVMIVGACFALGSCNGGKDGIKAALICLHDDSSTYDKNFIDAFKTACANKGVEYEIVTGIAEDTACYDAAADFADSGYDVIFADSFGHEPFMIDAAKEFPNVQFCHATGTKAHTENLSNYQNAFASIYEGRYLAGVAAGLKLLEIYDTDDDGVITDAEAKVGYVGAFPYAEVISGYTSFFLGVRSIVENATMEVRYTNNWYDPTAEMNTAQALIDAGCKLISQHADSMGAPTACENAGIPNVAYNVATGTNTFVIASRIDWVPYFEYMLDCVINGEDISADWTGNLANGAVKVTVLGAAAAEGTQAVLDDVATQLKNGTLKVFDCSKFTVRNAKADTSDFSKAGAITMDENGRLTAYNADVDDAGDYKGDTNVIKTENGVTFFDESTGRSAPYFDIVIDGITIN